MRYTKIPETMFDEIQINAGVLCKTFTPESGAFDGLFGATSGGFNFTDTVTYKDYGEDIDNCPKNMMELKRIEDREVKASGTFKSVSTASIKSLIGAADIDSSDSTHIIPRDDLLATDFEDVWIVGDYSSKNSEAKGGYIAIHMMNVLSTDGFSMQTADKEKGSFAFGYTAHYSMANQTLVPYEVYLKAGEDENASRATTKPLSE